MTTRTDPPASTAPGHHPHQTPGHGVHVADRRGLTATGAVGVALGLGALGGVIDVLTGPGLRIVFAVLFIVGCALAALKVHREDLVAAVVMPPLVYVVIALFAGVFSQTASAGGALTREALELASSLVLGAPTLLMATGAAFVIAVVRGFAGSRGPLSPAGAPFSASPALGRPASPARRALPPLDPGAAPAAERRAGSPARIPLR